MWFVLNGWSFVRSSSPIINGQLHHVNYRLLILRFWAKVIASSVSNGGPQPFSGPRLNIHLVDLRRAAMGEWLQDF